jgi:hypothetical protein
MALEKIVAWEIVGYTNDGQVINLSECPDDNDVTKEDYLYREHYKKRRV